MARKRLDHPTRLKIIQTGTHLYLEHGFTATTNQMICKQIHISPGQFTNFFPTKEHLLAELVEEMCEFQWQLMQRQVEEGATSLLAYCLELAAIAVQCEEDPVARDFFHSAYTLPLTLEIMRRSDAERAQRLFGEYCSDWTAEDFYSIQCAVTGIEYGALVSVPDDVSLEERIRRALDSSMLLFHVPEELRKQKIHKVLDMDYRAVGRRILKEFGQHIDEINGQAVEEALQKKAEHEAAWA